MAYFFLVVFLASLPTYFFPDLRIKLGALSVPYAVPLAGLAWSTALPTVIKRFWLDRKFRLLVAFPAFGLINLLSFLLTEDKNYDFGPRLILFSTVPVLYSAVLDSSSRQIVATKVLGVASVVALAYGFYGYVSASTGDPLEHALGYWGISYLPATRNSDIIFLQPGMILVAVFLIHRRSRSLLSTLIASAILAGFLLAVLLSYVRGAWISIAVTLAYAVSAGMIPRLSANALTRTMVLLCIAVSALGTMSSSGLGGLDEDLVRRLSDRFFSISTFEQVEGGNSNTIRLDLILTTIWIALSHPVVGVGPGSLYAEYAATGLAGLNHPENWYLNVLAESGLVSFGLLAWVVFRILKILHDQTQCRTLEGEWMKILNVWGSLLLVNWLVYGMFNQMEDNLWLWTAIGICSALAVNRQDVRIRLDYSNASPVIQRAVRRQ